MPLPRLALTAGEPAGVGPELLVRLATTPLAATLVAITDRHLLQRAAARCGLAVELADDDGSAPPMRRPGTLRVQHIPLAVDEVPGRPDPRNARHVLDTLAEAADGCMAGRYDAVVTAPLQKASINDAGVRFSGHTEFFAERAHADVVMMLASPELRVALATTHLPLAAVPAAITPAALTRTLRIVHGELQRKFGIAAPRVAVLGLNPHAGEGGHLGHEEIDTVIPVLDALRGEGMHLLGPLPADTAFVPAQRARYDAVLAMYHDQALPVLKSEAFDRTVNLTLGLPFIRTSVDHGTALDLAGSGRADPASLIAAANMALELVARCATHPSSPRRGEERGEGPPPPETNR
ncbi:MULTISPECIES: 4-hydroxythreonine-4-phosphate dehydrogenase PdxA [Rhodanobacter]|uniref:4-hydroxythreonine-4-phosphate dehydrogenase PdxA n=1 Tax=Rhodanobacter TaxID=75309 RepID=UPI0003F59D68|nr:MULTISPECIES: 4-hydroxythreonine-4-phosphate dehydrogenase PdxA [Rhodanobacter]KZC21727.1 4-hydroxythreonine-4-phosphate dehydrogenase PdxA [Rhodanobacter denitrificans]UJJ50413.1 4-hydroxythreonine-4-phosphate dehydrogenase PdxA [Rhodanobacter denitrificans]UJJ57404.1 4-hydroxythreonine-4-phosphate dehydrogenase PdxA [Rhodanobacter denitrificans]UJM93127.1 4-hydroxythreonine-4-phosphate dehydrogenase PdxA [Rhodanobacter denitrificans]UJM96659.1 4-hydroxythreonine-4-phosphate dehydrogenase 